LLCGGKMNKPSFDLSRTMPDDLTNWNCELEASLERIIIADRFRAGTLLSVIPERQRWEEFLEAVKAEWRFWLGYLGRHPYCLLTLYGGLAFYEYDKREFWPQFAKAVGVSCPSANRQNEINRDYARVAQELGLKILVRDSGTDYVGSAVYHIGVPLSMWDGFLEICEWALWRDDWKELSAEEWECAINRRTGSRTRLGGFLKDNREAVNAMIQELHDARRILTEDESLTINQIKQACLLRQEYFDEVPETAEFLRPSDPESLFQDRARLIWNEHRCRISLYLPSVARDKLPATWKIGGLTQEAAATPDSLLLNAAAFAHPLLLTLEAGERHETQRLRGLSTWGLFDRERNRFVNPERQPLPPHSYAFISRERLDCVKRRGFEEEENPANESCELEDGTTCYITQLWPTGGSAELRFAYNGVERKLEFRSPAKIEARLFAGTGGSAANFKYYQQCLKIEHLPLLCVAVPFGSFPDNDAALQRKFHVTIDRHQFNGRWEKQHEDDQRDFYFWRWDDEPQLHGKVALAIEAVGLGLKFEYQIEVLHPKPSLAECWRNLPGAFWPFVLLSQPVAGKKEGMSWDDLRLAREAIAPEQQKLSFPPLRKYANYGLLEQHGQRWLIAESRAVLETSSEVEGQLHYCGSPAFLWGLLRYLSDKVPTSPAPVIEVVNPRGELPFLKLSLQSDQIGLIGKYLESHKQEVRRVSDLWRL